MYKKIVDYALTAENLSLYVNSGNKWNKILDRLNFQLNDSPVTGIVGRSGSGKSMLAMCLAGLLQDNSAYRLEGELLSHLRHARLDIAATTQDALLTYRKYDVSIIFQDPYASLNSSVRCGQQIRKIMHLHNLPHSEQQIYDLLSEYGFSDVKRTYYSYPFELSGGECQRIVILMALLSKPRLIIADEPTSSLDSHIQDQVLRLLIDRAKEIDSKVIIISHDMKLIQANTQIIWVMNDGKFIAHGTYDLIKSTIDDGIAKHVFVSLPMRKNNEALNRTVVLAMKNVNIVYQKLNGWLQPKNRKAVVTDMTWQLHKGEILGLVGPSGSGKSSVAKALVRLIDITQGMIKFNDVILSDVPTLTQHAFRNDIQLIMQDSYLNFNPAYTVRVALRHTYQNRFGSWTPIAQSKILELIERMHLHESLLDLYPQQLSGGERQRIMLVRALILRPKVLICDESLAALDSYIKKLILDILRNLADEQQISIIYISHDRQSVNYVCDRVLTIRDGRLITYDEKDVN